MSEKKGIRNPLSIVLRDLTDPAESVFQETLLDVEGASDLPEAAIAEDERLISVYNISEGSTHNIAIKVEENGREKWVTSTVTVNKLKKNEVSRRWQITLSNGPYPNTKSLLVTELVELIKQYGHAKNLEDTRARVIARLRAKRGA